LQWIVKETDSPYSEALLARSDLIGPELLVIEVANVLRRKIEVGDTTRTQATEGLRLIATSVDIRSLQSDWLERALEIAVGMSHPIYDCLYLAMAEFSGARLVTRDRELMVRAERLGLGALVTTLPLDG